PEALPGGAAVEAAPEAFAPHVDAGVLGGVHGDDLDRGLGEAPARRAPGDAAVGALQELIEIEGLVERRGLDRVHRHVAAAGAGVDLAPGGAAVETLERALEAGGGIEHLRCGRVDGEGIDEAAV